jgi:hypothetical protein
VSEGHRFVWIFLRINFAALSKKLCTNNGNSRQASTLEIPASQYWKAIAQRQQRRATQYTTITMPPKSSTKSAKGMYKGKRLSHSANQRSPPSMPV